MNPESELKAIEQQGRLLAGIASDINDTSARPTAFEARALPIIARGIPIIPVPARTKITKLDDWPKLASTDPTRIAEWSKQYPDGNIACVAKAEPDGYWFFELDQDGLKDQIEKQTGQKFPVTFMVRSSPGRGHVYFKQNAASIAMGNRQAKDQHGRELWSARVSNRYVIGPNSQHPSGSIYTPLVEAEIVEAPQWLIDYCVGATSATAKLEPVSSDLPVVEGGRNNFLTSELGKARHALKMDHEQLIQFGLDLNQKKCSPPLPDSEVRTIAGSVAKYAITPDPPPVRIGGREAGQTAQVESQTIERPKLNQVPFPTFPSWVMKGTSIYDHFVQPICDQNSRIPYFMFVPAAALMLNYLALKVTVERKQIIPSFSLVLIGEKGRAIKSTSVEDAIEYLHVAGIIDHGGSATRVAEGKSLVWTPGSPEGLGLEMTRTNCKNAVMFYDELSNLTNKAGIDSSSLRQGLLTLYESGKFSNAVKSRKESFSLEPKTYCASLIACTTTENFDEQWSALAGKSSGLDDRFMFLLQPETLPELTEYEYVNTVAGSHKTKQLIDKAVLQKTYSFDDTELLKAKIAKIGNRAEHRAEKWALYFAVDLGRDSIDGECVERGMAIAEYELAVKKYLGSPEADTRIAAAQIKFRRILERQFAGQAKVRDMARAMNSNRYGTEGWYRIVNGLKQAGIIQEIQTGLVKEYVVIEPLDE